VLERFGTLWVGQVHHDELGFDAPAVNDRRYDAAKLASPMATSEQIAQLMDRCGYDTLWLAEHHFQHEGYERIPNIPLLATHLAGLTERLRFGCGFNVLPAWHPLRLAEDYAMADILTKGRVRLGVGRGYHSREVSTLRHPDATDTNARELFEEQVALLMTALKSESFSFDGQFYQVPPPDLSYRGYTPKEISLVPRPMYSTECWQPIVSATDRALDFMIEHGIKGFVRGGAASGGASEEVARRWQAKLAEHGRDTELGTDLIFGFSFLLADTVAEAKTLGRPILEEYQKMFAPLGFAGAVTDEQLEALGSPATAAEAGFGSIDDAVDSGSWLVGPAEGLIDAFGTLQETYPGLEEVMVAQPVGAHPRLVMDQLERFAEDVMPHFGPEEAA
jgi:alkanesulfonate monooxygenase SsuD/methylene tetrahydromethanopterin reductase-like flavin-dependent oxidoreductase (luciferase family)